MQMYAWQLHCSCRSTCVALQRKCDHNYGEAVPATRQVLWLGGRNARGELSVWGWCAMGALGPGASVRIGENGF